MSCSQIPKPGDIDFHAVSYTSSADFDTITVHVSAGHTFTSIPNQFTENLVWSMVDSLFTSVTDDSMKKALTHLLINRAKTGAVYSLHKATHIYNVTELQFIADVNYLNNIEHSLISLYVNRNSESFHPLFKNKIPYPDWTNLSYPKLIYPCKNVFIPKKESRLPNAPRDYRKGIHRGIDFFANWGTDVRAVAHGTVLRADHDFKEVDPEFRNTLLQSASKIRRTPSDVFEHILLGKTVILDHGLTLIPGFRVITIYAHLSHINKSIKPGVKISAGDSLGKTGNTGMQASTIGKKDGAHLHWEMILQSEDGEFYLGQGLPYDDLYPFLTNLFKN